MSTDRMDICVDEFDWSQWLQDESLAAANEVQQSFTTSGADNPGRDEHADDDPVPVGLKLSDSMLVDATAQCISSKTESDGMADTMVCRKIDTRLVKLRHLTSLETQTQDMLDQELIDILYAPDNGGNPQNIEAQPPIQHQNSLKRPCTDSMNIGMKPRLTKRALHSQQGSYVGSRRNLNTSDSTPSTLLDERLPISHKPLLSKPHSLSASTPLNDFVETNNAKNPQGSKSAPKMGAVSHTSQLEPPAGVPEGFCYSFKVSIADEPRVPRSRGNSPCLRCRIQKIKCSGSFPCQACQGVLNKAVAERVRPAIRWTACIESDIMDLNIFIPAPTQAILRKFWPSSRNSLQSRLVNEARGWMEGLLENLSIDKVSSPPGQSRDNFLAEQSLFLALSARHLVYVEMLSPKELSSYMASLWDYIVLRLASQNLSGRTAFLGAISIMYLNTLQTLIERVRRKSLHHYGRIILLAHLMVLEMLLNDWITREYPPVRKVLHLGSIAQHLHIYVSHHLQNMHLWFPEDEIKLVRTMIKHFQKRIEFAGPENPHNWRSQDYSGFLFDLERYIFFGMTLFSDPRRLFVREDETGLLNYDLDPSASAEALP